MTLPTFLHAVEAALAARFAACDRRELRAFFEAAWPLVEDDPDPVRWAGEFLAARREAAALPWRP